VNQGTLATPSTHVLRLVLMLFGAVLGLLVLSFVFGSSSASADDGDDGSLGSTLGGVVTEVAKPVHVATQAVAHTVSHATTAVTHAAPAVTPVTKAATDAVAAVTEKAPATSILAPVAPILTPIAGAVDEGLRDIGTAIGPVAGGIAAGIDTATAIADPTIASTPVLIANTAVSGIAHGSLTLPGVSAGGSDPGVSGASSAGSGLLATALAGGLFVLLAVRRQTRATPAMPGSPVYATDSSPD
jgi:hypothetical protein